LLLDEVLAVGDIGFRTKCYNRMERMKEHSAMILVSHQMSDIARIATRTLTHDQKRFVSMPTNEGIRHYGASLDRKTEGYEHCEPGFRIQSITVSPQRTLWKDVVRITLSFDSPQAIEDVEARVTFTNFGGEPLAEWRATNHANLVCLAEGQNTLEFSIGPVMLAPGDYPICIILTKPGLAQYLLLSYQQNMVIIGGGATPLSSHYQMDGSARMLQRSELHAAGLAVRG
jgi:lipopolysaccharide transport system ATP-binding protein